MRNLIMSALDVLRADPRVQVVSSKIPPPASDEILARAEAAVGFALPGPLIALYAELDGCHIEWSLRRGGRATTTSYLSLSSVEEMFGGRFGDWDDSIGEDDLWSSAMEPATIRELRRHRVLYSVVGSSDYITLRIDAEARDMAPCYVDRGNVTRLACDLDTYLRTMASCLGYLPVFNAITAGQRVTHKGLVELLAG